MDRFLKKRTATDSDPSSSSPHKKQKIPVSAKQGDISAAWRAQEFGSHFYESGGKLFCKCKPCNTVVRVTYLRSRMGSDRLYQEASSNNCLLISTRSSHLRFNAK